MAPESPPLAESWPAGGPRQVWQSEAVPAGQDGGVASPVVAEGRVYIYVNWPRPAPGSVWKPADDVFLCLDASDGTTVWRRVLPGEDRGLSGSSTPRIVGDRCYGAGSTGKVVCLDARTGEVRWQTSVVGQGSIAPSVGVADGVVVVQAGSLVALDARDGKTLWTQPAVENHYASPVFWRKDDATYVLANSDWKVACVELRTGKVAWTAPGGGCATPTVAGDRMAIPADRGSTSLVGYRLHADLGEVWWVAPGTSSGSSALLHEGHVYTVADGRLGCVRFESGEVAWEQRRKANYSSPVLADGKVLAVVDEGASLLMFAAIPDAYKPLAEARLPIAPYSSPAVADGRLVLRLKHAIACYDLRAEAPANASSQPAAPQAP
ncbi:MAG: PQQ-binding-like beta-propeller repeat protein [Candidatus Brocadiia bacterium]